MLILCLYSSLLLFLFSHAYLVYETHEDALNVFNSSKDLKILGKEVIVMFATYKNIASKNEEQSATSAAKKQKVSYQIYSNP